MSQAPGLRVHVCRFKPASWLQFVTTATGNKYNHFTIDFEVTEKLIGENREPVRPTYLKIQMKGMNSYRNANKSKGNSKVEMVLQLLLNIILNK